MAGSKGLGDFFEPRRILERKRKRCCAGKTKMLYWKKEMLYQLLPSIPENQRFHGFNLHKWGQFVELKLLGREQTEILST